MTTKYRQAYHRNTSFFKIMAILLGSILFCNSIVFYFSNNNQRFLAQIVTLLSLLGCGIVCILLIYKGLTYFIYEIIDDKLFFERAIGKSNHIYFHISRQDIIKIYKYDKLVDMNVKGFKKFKFVIDKEYDNWYVIDFYKMNRKHRLIINPNEEFLKGINSWVNK